MKAIQLSILLVIAAITAFAQQPLTLNDAVEKALANNYQIKITKESQRIAEIQNNWGEAGRYPYINLSLGDNNSFNTTEGDNYTNNRFTAGASINWTLFDGYSVRINKQKFEELEKLSKHNTGIMVESTIQAVILAYYSVLLEKEKLDVYKEVMTLSEDRFYLAEEHKNFGTYVTYDVLQAKNAYLSDRSGYLLQEVAWKNALRDLNYLMADVTNINYNLTDSFKAVPINYTLADLQSYMFENNKSLQNQYVNQRLLENAIAAAKSTFSPTLDFSGGVTGTSSRTSVVNKNKTWDNSGTFYGNFTLSFNLFSGGNRKRALQIASIEEETGLVETDDMKHDLMNRLSNLYEFYLVRKELLNIADENMAAAKLNLQISKEKFEAGAINSFNYRDVQNIYLKAASEKLEAIYDFIDTHTALLRMTGTIIQEYE